MSRKHRLNPSKLLVLLMYGNYPYKTSSPFGKDGIKVEIVLGKIAKLMRVRKSHIVEYLTWLEDMGYIVITELNNRKACVILDKPPVFEVQDD